MFFRNQMPHESPINPPTYVGGSPQTRNVGDLPNMNANFASQKI
ncbi:MAG: hypothetical protein ACRCUY_08210 [Thermoguttaceae bacterium]